MDIHKQLALVACVLALGACSEDSATDTTSDTAVLADVGTSGPSDADETPIEDVDHGLDQRSPNTTCVAPPRPATGSSVALTPIFEALRFTSPVWMLQAPGDDARWYVVEQGGRALRFENQPDVTDGSIVLDLNDDPNGETFILNGELGFLGMAFHPRFQDNGEIFLSYNVIRPLRSVVARAVSRDGGLTIDPGSIEPILELEQPYSNHNGGQILFGPDGYLYFGMGDGGSAGDPENRAQNLSVLFGKMIRIDVNTEDGARKYSIPDDNPFAQGGGAPEIFAWGLRNPWRFSFDRETGRLWAGDVGQGALEEVDVVELGGNYGWRIKEGTACYDRDPCDEGGLIDPIAEYGRAEGRSITGGYVYRGSAIPSLQGVYIYGDYLSGRIWGLFFDPLTGAAAPRVLLDSGLRISTFAEDHDGELYVVDYAAGTLFQFTRAAAAPDDRFPATLSATGCVDPGDPSQPLPGLIPYSPNAPFWSSGADKLRWFALPDGAHITVNPQGDWDLPIGSVALKTFVMDGVRIETRLMVRHDDGGWAGYTYLWNDDQRDAVLLPAGKSVELRDGTTWSIPSRSECLQCHTVEAGRTLGLETAQLNGPFVYPGDPAQRANQLRTLDHIGLFEPALTAAPDDLPALPAPDGDAGLEQRARAWLHTNCSHCHQPGGAGQGSADLRYTTPVADLGICDMPALEGDLGVAGARLLVPGQPDRSVLALRLRAQDVRRMPPLNGDVIDEAGAALIEAWIRGMEGCP